MDFFMFRSLLKNIFVSESITPVFANNQNKTSYHPYIFADNNRLTKIQTVFPVIDKIYKEYAEKNHFPGYAFGIMVDGQLVYSGSGGYINIKKKIPATTQSMFRIASMTKSFTAMAILKLRDEGKLILDDPVYFYIPEIGNQRLTQDSPEITIRDLLTHSAGFPQDDPWGDRSLHKTDEELITLLKKGISFSNIPGTTYEYSNLTFAMLGIIINRIVGTSYQEYIATNIWKPLEMKQAAWEFTNVQPDELAYGYKWINNSWKEEELLHDGIFGAMGGMITSIKSFSHYVALHQLAWPPRDGAEIGPIKRSSIREMQQPWRFHDLNPHYKYLDGDECVMTTGYGYGLRWLRNSDAKIYVGHGGGLPGFGSHWLIMPEYGIGVILFANTTYAVAGDKISVQILDTLVEEAQLKPRQLPPSCILKERQNALVKLLPDWKGAETSSLFAENFFLDFSVNSLTITTTDLFTKAGKIICVGEIIAENQLRGYFIIEGEKTDIKVSFTLTPQNPALIQTCQIEEVLKEK